MTGACYLRCIKLICIVHLSEYCRGLGIDPNKTENADDSNDVFHIFNSLKNHPNILLYPDGSDS